MGNLHANLFSEALLSCAELQEQLDNVLDEEDERARELEQLRLDRRELVAGLEKFNLDGGFQDLQDAQEREKRYQLELQRLVHENEILHARLELKSREGLCSSIPFCGGPDEPAPGPEPVAPPNGVHTPPNGNVQTPTMGTLYPSSPRGSLFSPPP